MLLVLIVLLIAIPIAELYVIVQVAQSVGVLNTIGLLIAISIIGAWLVKRSGLNVLARLSRQLDAGRTPTNELIDGALLMIAGALMFAPGFLSDILGILLILPPTRAIARAIVLRSFRKRIASGQMGMWSYGRAWRGNVVDVDPGDDIPPRPRPPRGTLEP